ncbi:sulfatase [Coraliomargarita algicola]|uniref:Sulfatase n=1 Tax=Coraliomargarita algicola TaxID=3092156 RepID=A0ABZ0RJ73_9BACT|nr:sulfatase [Coraliomargarita sp. J2-16]WPJ96254.1 sulfatase [Coraliomargarita sp. J2-16]
MLVFSDSLLTRAHADSSELRPNILWLTSEDNNIDWVGCYGNPQADTPHIDALAREGFRYQHAYASAPVCAPSRATWITGIHALSMGTHPMRSRYDIPHDQISYYPDLLKANGYTVGNFQKTDYNIGGRKDSECWDRHGRVQWNQLKAKQPFFQVINFMSSHESRAQGSVEGTKHDPSDVHLRAYHPDLPEIRKNYAKYYDAVKKMDREVGAVLKQLQAAGLAENTIVIYNSDHGGVLPRSKRFLFDSGLHCPLVIRIPEKFKSLWPAAQPGMQIDRLVSFVDMPKTWLSITGSKVPEVMQGSVFLGADTEPEPECVFAYRGRMGERFDNARAVCDKRYLYIRNYMPYVPWMQCAEYPWKMKASQVWEAHVQAGEASEVQSRWFAPKGCKEELYDLQNDPDNVENLIADPALGEVVDRMRTRLRSWQESIHDAALLPEADMVQRAAKHGVTIYEMVRDPQLYDLSALLDAADLALEQNADNLPRLRALLDSEDSGLRYWGIVGCFLLNDQQAGLKCLRDESREVRAMAAWILVNTGMPEPGLECLQGMLVEQSYATLKILNVIDWIGEDAAVLQSTVQSLNVEDYEARIRSTIPDKLIIEHEHTD